MKMSNDLSYTPITIALSSKGPASCNSDSNYSLKNIIFFGFINLSNLHHSVKIHITWFTLMTHLDWKELPWQTQRSRGPQTFLGLAWSWSFSRYTAGPVCLSLLEKAWFLEYTLQTHKKALLSFYTQYWGTCLTCKYSMYM